VAGRELGRTAGEIRLAYGLTATGQEFADALEDRGFILARVTEADAERLNRWERQRLKELEALAPKLGRQQDQKPGKEAPHSARADTWMAQTGGAEKLTPELRAKAEASYARWEHRGRYDFADYVDFVQQREAANQKQHVKETEQDRLLEKYKIGELVVVDRWANIHQLNFRNTGEHLKNREQRLDDIDRAPLLSVAEAENVMKEFNHHRQDEWQQLRRQKREEAQKAAAEKHWPLLPERSEAIRTSPAHHFEDAAREASSQRQPQMKENLRGAAAEIWAAYHQSDNARAFAAALEEQGISLAVVTKAEADRSHRAAEFARATGGFAPRYREGEIVAIVEPGLGYRDGKIEEPRVYRLSHVTTGEERWKIEAFLKPLDRSQLQGLDATKKMLKARAEQRIIDAQLFRDLLTEFKNAERLKRAQQTGREPATGMANVKNAAAMGLRAAEKSVSPVFRLLGAAGKFAEGMFELIDPVLTPALKREKEIVARTREAEAESTTDLSKHVAERRRQEEERPFDRRERERER
jgi:hypothetical protein